MSERRTLDVPPDAAGKRVDVWLAAALALPRARVKELLDRGAVRINGRPPRKGDRTVAGARVEVTLPDDDPRPVPQPELPLRILHVDAQLVAVDKPAGLPSHPLAPGERGTVVNALVARHPECADASADPREGGLVHRLDTLTSGALLAARTPEAWRVVREAFSGREVDKRYLAVVTGPIADAGEVDLPLRHRADHVEPALSGGGREALTDFRVLSRAGDAALLDVGIRTGVLHQIRAHLAAIGAPVLGDADYGGRPQPGLDRFFLHAARLGLAHPATGSRLEIAAPLPEELRRVLGALGLDGVD
ncbi:MAG TPA: RluA family pseudouridine synthase [Myxococcaceae bacterium]